MDDEQCLSRALAIATEGMAGGEMPIGQSLWPTKRSLPRRTPGSARKAVYSFTPICWRLIERTVACGDVENEQRRT
jgi:hypothetical protein